MSPPPLERSLRLRRSPQRSMRGSGDGIKENCHGKMSSAEET